jgi:glycosyltransferase involved in cell wall biosynthesis
VASPPPITRVLVVAPTPFFGDRGCHVRIYEEVRGLQAKGIEVLVTTFPTGNDPPGVNTRRAMAVPGVRARALGPSYGRPALDLMLLATTVRAVRGFKPQIIHAHLHEGIFIGTVARQITGIPFVADLQGSLQAELVDHRFLSQSGAAAGAVASLERWLVQRPDKLVASCAAVLPMLVAQGALPNRIVSLPDGADLEHFKPMPADRALRAELGLEGKQVVVFLGVLTPYQGVDALIDSIPDVINAVPDAHFLIMGYPNEERYRARIAAQDLQRSVTLPGRIPYQDAARWLSLGDVAVSPKQSLTEANGKLLNYMACGLPVVATDTAVNRELLGPDGVYVPVGHTPLLAERLIELLRSPERRQALGAALRQRAEREFDWTVLTDRLVDVYKRALELHPSDRV